MSLSSLGKTRRRKGRSSQKLRSSASLAGSRLSLSSTVLSTGDFSEHFRQLCRKHAVEDVPLLMAISETWKRPISSAGSKESSMTGKNSGPQRSSLSKHDEHLPVSKNSLAIRSSNILSAEDKLQSKIYLKYGDSDILQEIQYRDMKLNEKLWSVIQLVTPSYLYVRVLKFWGCDLTPAQLQDIAQILENVKTVRDLRIEANTRPIVNCHVILQHDTRITHLSLKHLRLTDDYLICFANELMYKDPQEKQTIAKLSLDNNWITCKGAEFLAWALRSNRSIASLGLAGNRIGDRGVRVLAEVLHTFSLSHDEVKLKRERVWPALARRRDTPQAQKRALSSQAARRRSGSTPSRSRSRTLKDSRSSVRPAPDVLRSSLDTALLGDSHPFVAEIVASHGELWCSGNLKLVHVDLSYNKITNEGVTALLEAATQQIESSRSSSPGLLRVALEGNPLPPDSQGKQNLSNLLVDRCRSLMNLGPTWPYYSLAAASLHRSSGGSDSASRTSKLSSEMKMRKS